MATKEQKKIRDRWHLGVQIVRRKQQGYEPNAAEIAHLKSLDEKIAMDIFTSVYPLYEEWIKTI